MTLLRLIVFFGLIFSGCATNYNTIKKPIPIPFAGDYDRSAHKKYEFLEGNFGKRDIAWELINHKVFEKNQKVYDRMTIRLLPDGQKIVVYFDMSDVANDLISIIKPQDRLKK